MGLVSRKDFILRVTEQMIELLAAALGLRKNQQPDEALRKLADGSENLLGTPRSLLDHVDSTSAARMLSEPWKIRMYARILREEAETLEELKRDSTETRRRAVGMIVEACRI